MNHLVLNVFLKQVETDNDNCFIYYYIIPYNLTN